MKHKRNIYYGLFVIALIVLYITLASILDNNASRWITLIPINL